MEVTENRRAESQRVRNLVVEAVEAAAELLAGPAAAERWDQPAALEPGGVGDRDRDRYRDRSPTSR